MEKLSRRKFLQYTGVTGAFLVVGCIPETDKKLIAGLTDQPERTGLNQFISIGSDGSIVLFNHRPEMGQGVFQSIPMILAEELEVEMDKVEIRQSEANRELYGSQMVVGSRSIRTEFDTCRKMGAAAREMLKQAAANAWEVEISECTAKNGEVIHKDGRKKTYGELVQEAGKLKAPENPPLKDPSDFTIIGKSIPRRDIPLKTNGEAKFGMDITVPDMLYASIERSPVFRGRIKSFNEEEVMKRPGVKHVFKTKRELYGDIEGVAVLADTYWNALQGRRALKIEWDQQGLEKISSESINRDSLEMSKKEGDDLFSRGNTGKVLDGSDQVIEAIYETPYQAHVPMEPMNAIVSIKEDSAEFWGSTQNPNGMRSFLAGKYNLPEDKVKINYTFIGGGFGRRSRSDVVEEAADLSQKSGKPVKVIWTREDDQTQGPFRACSMNAMRAVLGADGKIAALEHKVIAQEIRNQTGDNMMAGRQLMGGITTDYLMPDYTVRGVLRKHHIPVSYWRAVYHSTNPFAQECFIDELAIAAGKDPIQFRLDMLDHKRYRGVLEKVREITNWDAPRPQGIGKGVAVVERSGAYFAMVIRVEKTGQGIEIKKVTTALDLGICINPDTVKAQAEGSVIMGLGAVYYGLTVKNGAIAEQNFDTYPLLRMDQVPEIETHILDSTEKPEGAGESGLPTVAPALANAIFDLTGIRIRKLPFGLDEINAG